MYAGKDMDIEKRQLQIPMRKGYIRYLRIKNCTGQPSAGGFPSGTQIFTYRQSSSCKFSIGFAIIPAGRAPSDEGGTIASAIA
jgi:hypothetical protein